MDNPAPDFDTVRGKLKVKHSEIKNDFNSKYPHIQKYLAENDLTLAKIREHSAKIIGAGALAGSLLLSAPGDVKSLPSPEEIIQKLNQSTSTASGLPQKI